MNREQILVIEPNNILEFTGPFDTPKTCPLKLTNPTRKRVSYKIKTTMPNLYTVRPTIGFLMPGDSVNIEVTLQPRRQIPDAKEHKFKVQSVIVKKGEKDLAKIWDPQPQSFMETKLPCKFEMPSKSDLEIQLLKNELDRLKKAENQIVIGSLSIHSASPPSQMVFYLALSLIMILVGIFIGKYLI